MRKKIKIINIKHHTPYNSEELPYLVVARNISSRQFGMVEKACSALLKQHYRLQIWQMRKHLYSSNWDWIVCPLTKEIDQSLSEL
jgi:hypothetical protein